MHSALGVPPYVHGTSACEPMGHRHMGGPVKRTTRWRSVRGSIVRCSLLASVLLAAGCTHWGRRRVDQPTPVKPHAPVWIWSGDSVMKWHAVVITQDSVLGIPYRKSLIFGGLTILSAVAR